MSIEIPTKEDLEILRNDIAGMFDELKSELAKPMSDWMTKTEVADYLKCDVSKVNRYMSKGLPFKKFGANPLFKKQAIDDWLEKQK